jgi:hypothetical protein
MNGSPLIAAEGYYFLEKSNKILFFSLGFFAAQGLCPAKRAEPRAGIFCPTVVPAAPRFCKSSYALATHKATIVLPAFARSCLGH